LRIYYDLVLWEEVEENDTEKLKGKFAEMGNRFKGYGVLSFNMRAAPVGQAAPATETPLEEPLAEAGEGEVEYVDEQGNPTTPTEDDTIVDE